jgi:hypothetical protein
MEQYYNGRIGFGYKLVSFIIGKYGFGILLGVWEGFMFFLERRRVDNCQYRGWIEIM